jgi:hypothetical protein
MSIIFDLICFGCVVYMGHKLVKSNEVSYEVSIKLEQLSYEVEKLKRQINER